MSSSPAPAELARRRARAVRGGYLTTRREGRARGGGGSFPARAGGGGGSGSFGKDIPTPFSRATIASTARGGNST